MKVGRIYKINVGVALLYFVIVLATTILTMIIENYIMHVFFYINDIYKF